MATDVKGFSETARLEAFSDAVFAIAITLLVLEIEVPGRETTGADRLMAALLDQWPSFLGYVISFITIGMMWANHHAVFQYIRHSDRYFKLLNLLLLMCVSFLPFPTAVLAQHLQGEEARLAMGAYSGAFVVTALFYNAMWWYAIADSHLLDPDADPVAIRSLSRRYAVAPIAYGLSLLLAVASVPAALAVHGVLLVFYLVPDDRGSTRAAVRARKKAAWQRRKATAQPRE